LSAGKTLEARNRLRKLIAPFILRRTKSQVLTELPSRTEILRQVASQQRGKRPV
jgi:SNF2 family DNA or RNA helicase